MNLYDRFHFLVRAWRYRLREESLGVGYLRSRDLTNKTAVDIGANRGIYSYWMHQKVGAGGRVIAFEPQPELATYLHDARQSFGLNRLEIAECGLSSQKGELTLRRPKGHWGGSSFDRFQNRADDIDVMTTPVTTLDDYFANHPSSPVSFIKCDVEGHEFEVFRGAERVLRQDRPELLFECSHKQIPDVPVFIYLKTVGYEGHCFYENGFKPVCEYRSLYPRLNKSSRRDFVFLPREKAHAVLRQCA